MTGSRFARRVRLRPRATSAALVAALVAAALVLPTSPARALPDNVPVDTWVTNGNVHTVTRSGGRIYLGGLFDQVGPSTGFGVALDPATGLRDAAFPKVNGEVFAAVSDGEGGWLIGGDFTRVGGSSRHNAAQINANGTVGNWNPSTNYPVRAIAYSPAHARIFLGGDFTTLGGAQRPLVPRRGLAATDMAGVPAPFAPEPGGGTVFALALSPNASTLYVGGSFTSLGGRSHLAAVDAVTGVPDPAFSPNPDGSVSALAVHETRLYAGGRFTGGLAVLAPTGSPDPTWAPDTNGSVSALALSSDGSRLYLGGSFSQVGSQRRAQLAAIDTTGAGAVDVNFDSDAAGLRWPILALDDPLFSSYEDGVVAALALSGDGSRLNVGGFFANIGGQDRRFLAAVNAATGVPDAGFDAAPGRAALALAVSGDGARLFAGGLFTSTGGARRLNLAALRDTSGELDAGFTADADKAVNAVAADGASLYVGGNFTKIGVESRPKVAKLNAATGAVVAGWRASVSAEVKTLAVTRPSGSLILGGTFTTIGTSPRNRLASLRGDTGAVEAWNPDLDSGVYDLDVSPDGTLVYVGGSFTLVGGTTPREHLASFRLDDIGTLTGWKPAANDVLRRLAVSPDGQRVFVGLGGGAGSGNRVQAFSTAGTGTIPHLWQQTADGDFTGLDVSTSVVYAGGHFSRLHSAGDTAGDTLFQHLAAFDQLTGAPLLIQSGVPWGPPIAGVLGVLDIEVTPGSILVAGEFHKVGVGETQVVAQGFASFSWTGDPDVGSPTTAPPTTAPPTTTPPTTAPPVQPPAAGRSGYWLVSSDGEVYPFGDAADHGDARSALPGGARAVDLEATPAGRGYWIIDDRGDVFAFGDASRHGGVEGVRLAGGETVTSLSATPSGSGYWIFTSRGRAIARGDAIHHGDMSAAVLNGPVLDSIPTPSGRGYYMVASDGGIFAFGDAEFFGSMGGKHLNKPVQSLVPDPDRAGYWLVASDGGVFAFGAPFRGSMGGKPLNKPMTGMVPYGNGYLMVAEDGGIFVFSDRPFSGSLGSSPPARPVVSVAALQA